MTIQLDWQRYCANVLPRIIEDDVSLYELSLLRHAFFCGASTTYGVCYEADSVESVILALNTMKVELEAFMHERNPAASLH